LASRRAWPAAAMNTAFALGSVAGPAGGSAIAGATGGWIPFVLAAGLCSIALVSLRDRKERRCVARPGAPGV
jgi:hypothetical protein